MSKPIGPGDRAIVIKALHVQNIGKVVRVISVHAAGEQLSGNVEVVTRDGASHKISWGRTEAGAPFAVCESLGRPFETTVKSLLTGGKLPATARARTVPIAWLKRLGDDDEGLVEDRQREEVTS